MSQTTLYPWGRNKPEIRFDPSDKLFRKFKSVCSYQGVAMNRVIQNFTVTYAMNVGIEDQDPYKAFKYACEITNSAMRQQVLTMMEDFIKTNRIQ